MTGIYKIENLINGKVYIGQAININKRWNVHKLIYNDIYSSSYKYPLYRAMRKYGIENFSFEVLEECKKEELNEKEKFYINKFNSYFKGYNQTLGGQSRTGSLDENKEIVIGIISDLENTNMLQGEIAKKWGVNISTVNGINTGRVWKHNRNYPIQNSFNYMSRQNRVYSGKRKDEWFCCDCKKPISQGAIRCKSCEGLRRKNNNNKISREELKKLIRSTPFTTIGKMYGVSDNTIRKWCDNNNLPRKAREIKKYSDEEWEKI